MLKRIDRNGIRKYIIVFVTLLMAICFVMGNFFIVTVPARAEENRYSTVTEDFASLNIDYSKYPMISDDFSLSVIQIAESNNNELFVYVYQPSGIKIGDLKILLSFSTGDSAVFSEYDMKFIAIEKTILKYVVVGIVVDTSKQNIYNITSVSRIALVNMGESDIKYKAYPVAQVWTASTNNGRRAYVCKGTEVVIVTGYYASSIRYVNRSVFYPDAVDSFYVAFSTDRDIDKLLEADVSFEYFPYTCDLDRNYKVRENTYIEVRNATVSGVSHLTYDGVTDIELNGIVDRKYSWKWIQSSDDFISEENLSDATKKAVKDQQWVLRYFGSDLRIAPLGGISSYMGYSVNGYTSDNVTILRLKFETNGEVYNLGVVMDHLSVDLPGTGDQIVNDENRDNNGLSWWEKFLEFIKKIMSIIFNIPVESIEDWQAILFFVFSIIIIVVLFIVLAPFLPMILNGIATAIAWIFKALWIALKYIVLAIIAPFKWLIHKIRGDGDDGDTE